MTDRIKLPNRRPSFTRKVVWQTETSSHAFHLNIGLEPSTGRVLEVFYADGQKSGSQLRQTIQDGCILISLLLQHGADPSEVQKSLSTIPLMGRDVPASVLGLIVQAVIEEDQQIHGGQDV